MQSVTIFPITNPNGAPTFHAVAGCGHSEGRTAGEALDALRPDPTQESSATVVVIQPFLPDAFFSAAEQARLQELMGCWRAARDSGGSLPVNEQAELESLIESELQAATLRTAKMIQDLGK